MTWSNNSAEHPSRPPPRLVQRGLWPYNILALQLVLRFLKLRLVPFNFHTTFPASTRTRMATQIGDVRANHLLHRCGLLSQWVSGQPPWLVPWGLSP